MNAFDNWLKSMADNSKTCDTVISESTKRIKRYRLGKLSEDEQGMIKYRRLLDMWVRSEKEEDYVRYDDDDNEIEREDGETNYYLKDLYSLTISNPDYTVTFDGKIITSNDLKEHGAKSLYNVFTNGDVWSDNVECKFSSIPSCIGKMIYETVRDVKDDDGECGLDKAGNILEELFETLQEYDVGKIEKFIKRYQVEINEKTGTIMIPYGQMGTLFNVTLVPQED